MKENKTTPFYFDNTEAWGTDSFYVLGITGFFLYVLLALTSLPSVGGSLSWREFTFIQVRVQLELKHAPFAGASTNTSLCLFVWIRSPLRRQTLSIMCSLSVAVIFLSDNLDFSHLLQGHYTATEALCHLPCFPRA